MADLNGRVFAGLYSRGLWEWEAATELWEQRRPVEPLTIAAAGGTLVVGHNPGGLHWSEDQAVTWRRGVDPSTAGVGKALMSDAPVWRLESGDELVLAGVADGVYLSRDLGRTWRRVEQGIPAGAPGIAFYVGKRVALAAVILGGSIDSRNSD
ncbi:WD40/YVTN/BNR-like repeat-containing protein [Posidoniimonas polymericola]|nr:hypothetical protein [Posidoniimonas polymericola]